MVDQTVLNLTVLNLIVLDLMVLDSTLTSPRQAALQQGLQSP
jgi:hypothetical protein